MILPNNGKVVIIDDKPEDVVELIAALSKEKIPFVHYKEENLSDLPESPIENVRLVFLDLELVSSSLVSSKDITGPIKTRLSKILKPNTPYALVIWSKKEGKYTKELLKDFDGEFLQYKPIFHTALPKADIIGKKDAITTIKKELEAEISKFKSFNAFLAWEGIVNESAGKLTNDITTLYPPDADWNNKTKFLLYKLAVAYSGKAVDGFPQSKKLKKALNTLTISFSENIENLIERKIDESFDGLVDNTSQSIPNFTSTINKFLMISESNDDSSQPGNIFFPEVDLQSRAKELDRYDEDGKQKILKIPEAARKTALEGHEKKMRREKQEIDEVADRLKKSSNDITFSSFTEEANKDEKIRNEILRSIIPIFINVTPLCDYAQDKVKLLRILPGVMVKSEFRQFFSTANAYSYVSEADFRLENSDRFFLFDFRFLHSEEKGSLSGRHIKYRFRQEILSDIQIKLGAHINRTGVLYVK
jgi:hypothetical protein